ARTPQPTLHTRAGTWGPPSSSCAGHLHGYGSLLVYLLCSFQRHFNFPTRRLPGLLHEHLDHNHAAPFRGDVDRPGNAVFALHAHLPQGAFQMFYMRLAHLFEAMRLNQLDNPAETRFHVGRESFQLISNAGVEQLYDPHHTSYDIAFLQYRQGPSLSAGRFVAPGLAEEGIALN